MRYVQQLRGQFFCIKMLKAHNCFKSFQVGKMDLQKKLTEPFSEVNHIVFFVCINLFFLCLNLQVQCVQKIKSKVLE